MHISGGGRVAPQDPEGGLDLGKATLFLAYSVDGVAVQAPGGCRTVKDVGMVPPLTDGAHTLCKEVTIDGGGATLTGLTIGIQSLAGRGGVGRGGAQVAGGVHPSGPCNRILSS